MGWETEETRLARRDLDAGTLSTQARDSRLVARTLAGDQEAFEDLIRLYYDRIRALVFHHLHREEDLDDALQEIFIKAYQALPNFKRKSSFYTWIFRIATNFCIDKLRKKRLELVSLEGENETGSLANRLPEERDSPEENLSRIDRVRLVRDALSRLDPFYQSIIVLREIEGLSYEEIMETLGINMGTVKSRLARGRAELKKILEDMDVI